MSSLGQKQRDGKARAVHRWACGWKILLMLICPSSTWCDLRTVPRDHRQVPGCRGELRLGMLLLLACWLLGATAAGRAQQGQEVSISTDRPSLGTGPDLVPAHRLIAENGIAWTVDQALVTLDLPETLYRVGVSRDVELRFAPPNLEHTYGTGQYQQQDLGVSAKLRLPSPEAVPAALVLGVTAPTGSKGVSAGGWDPFGLLSLSHVWNRRLGSFASADVIRAGGGSNGRSTDAQLALDGLWNTTDTVTNYVEYAPLLSTGAESSGYTLDTGVLWVVRRFVQFDAHAGRSWTSGDAATVVGLGFSFDVRRSGIAW